MAYKFFRVATEGATTDGRKISREDIINMAANYDPATRAARVNVEHVRGFGAYGDVLALKTDTVTLNVGGKPETRLALYAQIKPLDNLKALNQASQKLYSSVEIAPNFAGSGKAYLMGVAVTDNPASLGTEVLQFCSGAGDKSFLAQRKQEPGTLFTETEEIALDFTEAPTVDPAQTDNASSGLVDTLKALLGFSNQQPAPVAPVVTAPAAPAPTHNGNVPDHFSAALVALAEGQDKAAKAADARAAALEAQFATMKAQLERTAPGHFSHRPPATGKETRVRADC